VAPEIHQRTRGRLWSLVKRQHGVVTKRQLLELGYSLDAIRHRIETGRLHPTYRGVYAVGRPQLTEHGRWMAAVLGCGPEAVLSHESGAALLGIGRSSLGPIHISVPARFTRLRPGIAVHRRALKRTDVTEHQGIPVTSPVCTLVDLAARIDRDPLEAAINQADKLDLVDPEQLRLALDHLPRRPGVGVLRRTLDRRTFTLTDSELERLFLPIARRAGLGPPETGCLLNGFKVDFYWPDLGLVVETDGLRGLRSFHRTAAQQARDRVRDQAHTTAGLTPLRFTRAQVRFEPGHVRGTLAATARRLAAR
jgi:hypothetical protein